MSTSDHLFERACRVIPGGVNSPVRAFKAVGGRPVYMQSAEGCRLTTADGRELIDFVNSWGPLILGHADADVVAAVREAAGKGTSYGANHEGEVRLAELLTSLIPAMDMVRLVNSGTEATMTALRLARGHTGRNRIVKFDGCYHGHADYLLVSAGSGLLTGGIGSSAGVPADAVRDVFVLPYNDDAAARELFSARGGEIAAVIVEPLAGNMGLVEPAPGFLKTLRDLCSRSGSLLIFDEVITGFRTGLSAYATFLGIAPDLICLGKIIGGGLPIGAVGGSRKIMEELAPLGRVYQAGTLSGNPLAVAAGIATIEKLRRTLPYDRLAAFAERIAESLNRAAGAEGRDFHVARAFGMFTPFFKRGPVRNLEDGKGCDTGRYGRFFRGMLDRGFYLPPSQYELCFTSAAMGEGEIDRFISAAGEALTEAFGKP